MKKILASLTVALMIVSMFSIFAPSVKACPLFIQENAVFMTNMDIVPISHSFYECPESAPMFVLELSPTDTSYELSISFYVTDTSVAAFLKVIYCDNSTVYRHAVPSSSLVTGWNTLTATLPPPSEGEIHGVRIVGVAGHRDDDGLEPWVGATDENFGTHEGDWNLKIGDGYFAGKTAEDLDWYEYEVAYHFTLKTPGLPQHNPFIGSLTLTPSKTTLSPGETFTVTARYYRYSYCPSDYFKILCRKQYDRQAAYNYAQQYWDEVCSDGYFWNTQATYISLAPGTDIRSMTGFDCAHFVSCCIGNEPNRRGGGLDVPSRVPPTYGEPGAARLGNWLIENRLATSVSSVDQLEMGDVINYDWDGDGHWDHITLYLGGGKVTAHTECVWNADWRLGGAAGYRFIHIVGGPVTEVGRWAASYWQMVSYGWQTFTITLMAPSTAGIYTLKAVGCSGHGTYNYYGVDWNDPRYDGDFRGHKPEEMSWTFYEISAESTLSVGYARFHPKVDGFGFDNYGPEEGCIAYTFREVYDRLRNDPEVPSEIPLEIFAWIVYQLMTKAHEGHCGGMCRAALYYYDHPEMIPNGFEKLYDIKEEDKDVVFNLIDFYQTEQFFHFDRDLKHILAYLGDDPTGLLSTTDEISWFKNQWEEDRPAYLTVLDPARGLLWGHAVVAYDYEEDEDYVWIYFYNPNDPGNENAYLCLEKQDGEMTVFYDGTGFNCPRFYFDDAPTSMDWTAVLEYLSGIILPEIRDQFGSMFSQVLSIDLFSCAELHLYDSSGNHVGQIDSSETSLEFDAFFYVDDMNTQHCIIPNPEGGYRIELVGVSDGSWSLEIELIMEGTTVSEQIVSGEIAKDAIYVYAINIGEDIITIQPDPAGELQHLKEFVNALPKESFKYPKLAGHFKKALSSKIDEVILKIEAGNYTDAINKLFYDVRAKMDGDSTAEDWIIGTTAQFRLCVIIDHIISNIEMLREQTG